jgi:hypothetical protein
MKVQGLMGMCQGGKLVLAWRLFYECKTVLVSIAKDSEFTDTHRLFAIPYADTVVLDSGPGRWFVRVGVWGDVDRKVEWSGIFGPVLVISSNTVVPLPASTLPILYTEAITGAVRIHTGNVDSYYAVIEYSTEPTFKASMTKMLWENDGGRGYVDCTGLLYDYTYYIRISAFSADLSTLPLGIVKTFAEPVVVAAKKPARPIKYTTNVDYVMAKADEVLLRDAKLKGFRISSYTDYLRLIQAQARTTEQKQRL